jgi:hypothetical protein
MEVMLPNQFIVQKNFSRPSCGVREEENIFVLFGVLLDVLQRLKSLANFIP